MNNNIILIGLPGAGKSTVGVLLAKLCLKHFADTDLLIQAERGKRLPEIIEEVGKTEFLRLENELLSQLKLENTVIATGGSAVYGKEAMEHLQKMGKVVYLKISYETLCNRVGNLKDRGVVSPTETTFERIWEERCRLYEKYADVTVPCEFSRIEDAASAVLEGLSRT